MQVRVFTEVLIRTKETFLKTNTEKEMLFNYVLYRTW